MPTDRRPTTPRAGRLRTSSIQNQKKETTLPTGMAGEVRVEKRQRNADSQRFDRSAWTRWEHGQPNAHAGHVLAHILLSRVFRRLPGSSCVRPLRLSGRSLPMSRQMRANSWAPRMHYPAQRAGVKSAPHRTEAHAR